LTADVSAGLGAAVTGATVTIQNAGLRHTALVEAEPRALHGLDTSLPSGDFTLSVVKGMTRCRASWSGARASTHQLAALNSTATRTAPRRELDHARDLQIGDITTRNYSCRCRIRNVHDSGGEQSCTDGQRVIIKRANEVEIARGCPDRSCE